MNYTIPKLAANTGLATSTLFEQWNMAAGGKSQQYSMADLVTFLSTAFSSLNVAGGKILLNADGSISFANGAITIDSSGNLNTAGEGTFAGLSVAFDNFLVATVSGDVITNGTASFGAGNFTIDTSGDIMTSGTASFANGNLTIDTSGDLTTEGFVGSAGGNFGINADGSASFAAGVFAIAATGDLGISNTIQLNADGSGNVAGSGIEWDTSGNLTLNGTLTPAGGIVGTTAVGNATAGNLGEFVSALVAIGGATALTTATGKNITSISLTAGDWDVEGNVNFTATTATATGASGGITLTTGTVPTDGSEVYSGLQTTLTSATNSVTLPRKRINVNSTQTVFLVAKSTFSAGTISAFGSINARRVR